MRILLLSAIVLVTLWAAAWSPCAEEAPVAGTLTGILTAKGPNWIEVKADGAKDVVRYIPCWRGGLPKDGGGFDKAMLETIKTLVVPNRVKLDWQMEEHLRVVSIAMLLPKEKTGTLTGVILAKGKEWVEIKADGADGVPARYTACWIGGLPKDGGGLDKAMLEAIAARKIYDRVEITWRYDERLRVVEMEPLDMIQR